MWFPSVQTTQTAVGSTWYISSTAESKDHSISRWPAEGCTSARRGVSYLDLWLVPLGEQGSTGVLTQAVQQGKRCSTLLEKLRKREMVVQMQDCALNAEGQGDSCWPLNRERLRVLLRQADGLLPNSWLELQALRNDLQWEGDCFEIAHYGVDPSLFLDADPELFREQTGLKEPFIMQAGRIEPGKNQAMLCWALRKTDVPIVLIGGSKHWPSYAELCRSISGPKLTIIDHIPQHLLASAYAAAAVHTLPSWMETCGLVSLEAALSGTPLVGSTFGMNLNIRR